MQSIVHCNHYHVVVNQKIGCAVVVRSCRAPSISSTVYHYTYWFWSFDFAWCLVKETKTSWSLCSPVALVSVARLTEKKRGACSISRKFCITSSAKICAELGGNFQYGRTDIRFLLIFFRLFQHVFKSGRSKFGNRKINFVFLARELFKKLIKWKIYDSNFERNFERE